MVVSPLSPKVAGQFAMTWEGVVIEIRLWSSLAMAVLCVATLMKASLS
jgi:hypothetical protein